MTVRALYPGASAEVLEQTVASPLETQINGVIAYRDLQHLSPEYVSSLEPLLAAALARVGVG